MVLPRQYCPAVSQASFLVWLWPVRSLSFALHQLAYGARIALRSWCGPVNFTEHPPRQYRLSVTVFLIHSNQRHSAVFEVHSTALRSPLCCQGLHTVAARRTKRTRRSEAFRTVRRPRRARRNRFGSLRGHVHRLTGQRRPSSPCIGHPNNRRLSDRQ